MKDCADLLRLNLTMRRSLPLHTSILLCFYFLPFPSVFRTHMLGLKSTEFWSTLAFLGDCAPVTGV